MTSKRICKITKILYFCLAFSLIFTAGTFARFLTCEKGSEAARVADVYLSGNVGRCTGSEIIIDASSIKKPGDSLTFDFSVKNNNGKQVISEVALIYNLNIMTTDNIPLSYELKNSSGRTIWNYTADTKNNGTVIKRNNENEISDILQAGISDENVYSMKISWTGSKNKSCYAGLVEYIEINADARQVD